MKRTVCLAHFFRLKLRCAPIWAALIFSTLSACGGGGSGGGSAVAVPSTTTGGNSSTVPAPSGLSYQSPNMFTVGQSIGAISPTVTGSVTQYSISPALPSGLLLDAASGRITGTPSSPSLAIPYVVTGSNAAGSTTFSLIISTSLVRSTADNPDNAGGLYQVHVIYAVPSGGADAGLDTNGTIENSIRSANAFFANANSNRQNLRFDVTTAGFIDVTFVRLPQSDAAYASQNAFARDAIESDLRASGTFDFSRKLFLVYYEGTNPFACGGAPAPTSNGHVTAIYIHGAPPGAPACDTNHFATSPTSPAGYLEWAAVHELVHALGFVTPCSPHYSTYDPGHTGDDPHDLMWGATSATDTRAWTPTTIDPGQDDYYGVNVPSTCTLNLMNSVFLTPQLGNQLKATF